MKHPEQISPDAPLIEMSDAAIAPPLTGGIEVEGINWRVNPKDFWVVAGLFGSGKSDFLGTAAGLQRPSRGLVKLFGHETFTLKEEILVEHRRRIGLVFCGGGRLFNRLTVAENVALPLRYHENWTEEKAEDAVREILELTDLVSYARRIPSTLSSTWQQRAALARALILKPEILLLDKPLSGMDFRHERWWLEFLKNLSDGSKYFGGKPITIIATTENFGPWKDVAKNFALLKNNRWQEIGSRAELDASGGPMLREVWTEDI